MKKALMGLLCLSLAGMTACNDDSESNTGSSSGSTVTTTTDTAPVTAPATDTTQSPQGGSGMMGAMDRMMADMKAMQPSGDPDHDYATMMRRHHQGAVDMSNAYLPEAKDTMIRAMAQRGIQKQQQEIAELTTFLNGHQPGTQKNDFGQQAMQMMMDMMKMGAMPADPDKAFVMMMIPHHESGVHVSQMYAPQGKDAGLKAMASKVAKDQQKEADEMKRWQQAHK